MYGLESGSLLESGAIMCVVMACGCGVACVVVSVFCVKQKTAYEMRISDWSSDVCSSDLLVVHGVTLETEALLAAAHTEHGGELTRIHVETTAPIGTLDRKSVVSGKSVSVRVDLGGRRIIKKKKPY